MSDFLDHPNWCHMDNSIQRIETFLDSLEQKEAGTTQQDLVDDSTLLSREPIVISGSVNLQLSEMIESDVLNRLHKHSCSGAAVAMVPNEDDRILESLCEAIIMLFPVEPDRRHEPSLPFTWVPALKRSIAESHVHADLQRYILVDQFHLIHSAPFKDQQFFGRILQQLAAIDTVTVIVGVNEASQEEAAELLGFLEIEEVIPSKLPRHHVRPEVQLVKLNTSNYRTKRRAAETGVALAGCIVGAALMAFYLGKKSDAKWNFTMSDAVIESIDLSGQRKLGGDFAKPSPLVFLEEKPVALVENEVGPDLEVVEKIKANPDIPEKDMLYFVAESYCFGNGVEVDLERGLNYLNQAYNVGSEKAANLLGTCYSKGLGVDRNPERAFSLYEEAVDRGDIYAFGNIGVHYLRGWGCNADPDKASEMFQKGADLGDPVAALYLAKCLEAGIANNGKPDSDEARRWYVISAEEGNEEALAWCREQGVEISS